MAFFVRLLFLFIALFCTAVQAAETAFLNADEQAWVKQHPEVTVLIVNTHVPMTFLNDDGKEAGFVISLLDRIREQSGLRFRWQTFDNLPAMRAYLKQHPDSLIGVADASMTSDPQIIYSTPYQSYDWMLVTRKDMPEVNSLEDMAHQKVAVFTGIYYLPELRAQYPQVEFVEHDFSIETALSLLTQSFSGAIVPQSAATFLLKSYLENRFRVAGKLPLMPLQLAMATGKNNRALIAIINKTLVTLTPHEMDMELSGWQMRYALDRFEIWGRYRASLLTAGVGAIVVTLLLIFYYWRSRILRSNLAIQRTLRRALQDANQQIEKTSEAKSLFLSQMSHEIRTPLNALIGLLELESHGRSSPEMREKNIAVARDSASSLLSLVGDILDMAKIESGTYAVRREPVSLSKTVEDITTLFRHSAHAKGLELNTSTDVVTDLILFDPVMLRQIMSNLLSNAVKFTEYGEVDMVVYQSAEGDYLLEVTDSGPGLTQAQQNAIFEPFVQVGEHSSPARGTGLGLSICRQLAELLAGTLTVESVPGEGSTFIFRFSAPLSVVPAQQQPAPLLPTSVALRILIVDDHAPNRLLLEQQLAWAGHRSVSAENAEQALFLWQREDPPFDALITDCNMPGMSGFELVERLRKLERDAEHPPSLMLGLTAMAEAEVCDRAKAAGMNDCLFKPVELAKLLALIDTRNARKTFTLETLAQTQPETFQTLITAAIEQNDRDMQGLEQAFHAEDREQIKRHAHSLSGGARLIRAESLAKLSQRLEQEANTLPMAEISTLIRDCQQQVSALRQRLLSQKTPHNEAAQNAQKEARHE